MKTRVRNQRAFTIVELAIVMVVIAILVVVVAVSYRGIQDRARDAARRNDIAILTKALQQYRIERGNYATDNCGDVTSGKEGSGYLVSNGNVSNRLSTYQCLIDGKFLDKQLQDPSGLDYCTTANGACNAYMRISCTAAGSTYGQWIAVRLSTLPSSSTATDATCWPTWDSEYGMNYLVKVD